MEDVKGKVYLIGAGPGDEELITLKAIKALKKCDVVLYDRLVGGNILKYLNESCAIYYCGKEPGCHYKTQDEINDMLVKLAKEGNVVGRVKGGDPYVFGRGGEEALRLREEGIQFITIPGITSPISVLNYAGIPITQRGIAQSFHIYTGMSAQKLNINWESAVNCNGTLVFLMGLDSLEEIANKLMENGLNVNTPAAVIMRGTTSKQNNVIGEIENIVKKVKTAGLKSPCIIAFGEVISLSDKLNWNENMPLFGMNVCVTRSKEQAKEICNCLLDLGAQVTEINSIVIKENFTEIDKYKEKLGQYDYIVLTSVNAVNIFFNYLKRERIDVRVLKAKFAVIGKATQEALEEKGVYSEIKGDQILSSDLAEKLIQIVKAKDRVFIPTSKLSKNTVFSALTNKGIEVDQVAIYEPRIGQIKSHVAFEDVDVVIYTSPSIVRNTISMVGLDKIMKKKSLAIGEVTAKELIKYGINPIVCDEQSNEGIISKLLEIRNDKSI